MVLSFGDNPEPVRPERNEVKSKGDAPSTRRFDFIRFALYAQRERFGGAITYKSGDKGIGTSVVTDFTGPAADGLMSKSKICVGSHKVAHAFGISTTPLICP